MLAVLASPPARATHIHPISCPVTGACEAPPFHKGLPTCGRPPGWPAARLSRCARFQPLQTLPVFFLPIGINTSSHSPQDMAGQMRNLHPRENQKSRIVGDPCQALLRAKSSVFEIPVPTCTTAGRGTKKQCSDFPSSSLSGQIPEVLAHHPKPQIMVVRQIIRPSPMRLRPGSHNLQARWPHLRKTCFQALFLRDARA